MSKTTTCWGQNRWSKVGGREKRGLEGGYLVNSTSSDLPPCHPCVDPPFIPPPSFVVIPPLPTKLFTVLLALEGRIIADRLPTFDSMKTFRTLGEQLNSLPYDSNMARHKRCRPSHSDFVRMLFHTWILSR